ncbi:MAG TPA: XdhC/CoxI family protein [Bacillota bacterium]|nr:XdhC/CoxI family protein [Bacillota bacterium]
MDGKLRDSLIEICAGDQLAALVTIIRVKGSTPRKPGAKMLVLPGGQVYGTIGGGCGEAEVLRETLTALSTLQPSRYIVNMTNFTAEEEGMLCGGTMEVFIDILGPGRTADKKVLSEYLAALAEGGKPILATVVGCGSTGSSEALGKKFQAPEKPGEAYGNPVKAPNDVGEVLPAFLENAVENPLPKPQLQVLEDSGYEVFIEPTSAAVSLVILGGGHIALPLASMADLLGYRVTVVDDRPSFANPGRFPKAERVICDSFEKALKGLEITPDTYIVIVTRGHRHDRVCLEQVVSSPAGYLGMIGSRRRVKALLADLEADGVSPELLNRIHAPIGLAIGAETPAEIAVSIIGEIISVHHSN